MSVIIWHNPRCSKSRQTLAILEENGVAPEVRLYLQDAPNADEIAATLGKLDVPAIDMMRTGEAVFREMGLSKSDDEIALIAAMAKAPILIERPIVFANGKAAIGRPPEAVLEIL
ncbi:MAG: arsenate reductase (glutaredoxin) [Boseongicola sp.]|nr:arsenate reductase (glutaredoxin) [Boseongicola sp.]MDD9977301.1 arsenate reductase (glutaredoxin) [Boseongicola sp.]